MRSIILSTLLALISAAPASNLTRYESKYYTIYTDLDPAAEQEVSVRLTKMAELYTNRTRGFSGTIRQKFPFMLFREESDYLAAGGPAGSAGLFDGMTLMAVAGDELSARTWHVLQHEGFHQFAANVIRGNLPIWVNEGLAEYFGEGIFTGDDIVTGIVPDWRRLRVKKEIETGQMKPIDTLLHLPHKTWNDEISIVNYDQAWSIVQFLAHGDNGKYQPAFIAFMNNLSAGQTPDESWRRSFGSKEGFEDRWKNFWTTMPANPSDDALRRATVATLTSFVARSWIEKQTFTSLADFAKAGENTALLAPVDQPLPRSLLAAALDDVGERMKNGETFSLEIPAGSRQPTIVAKTAAGARVVGEFAVLVAEHDEDVIRVHVAP